MQTVFPSAVFYKRQGYALKKIVEYAKKNDFTDVVVVNEDKKILNGMVVCHLPDGPTAMFNLSSVVLNRDIKGRGKPTEHKPELVLNNFGTRLGYRIGRMFGSLFCQDPTFRGRRVITFHNQRDYIFFRHHRYAFEEKERDVVTTTVKDGKKKVKTTGSETFVAPRLQVGRLPSPAVQSDFVYLSSLGHLISRLVLPVVLGMAQFVLIPCDLHHRCQCVTNVSVCRSWVLGSP